MAHAGTARFDGDGSHALTSDHLTEPLGAHGLPPRGATTHPFGEVIYVSAELIEENHDTH
jgi:hypothetical protein